MIDPRERGRLLPLPEPLASKVRRGWRAYARPWERADVAVLAMAMALCERAETLAFDLSRWLSHTHMALWRIREACKEPGRKRLLEALRKWREGYDREHADET